MKKTVLDHALKVRLPITIVVILISFALTFYLSRAERDGVGYSPEQPIKYSHKLHAGTLKIDCKYCHNAVDKSRHAMVPSASTCMNCHQIARKDKPEIVKLKKYYDEGKPIPWKRIHKVPEYAYFNHSAHVNKNIDCISCHGDVAKMEVVEQVHAFTMGKCLECHREPAQKMPYIKDVASIKKGPEDCGSCHR
jgi:hypothetical protein